jgi:PAS domain-containing protein
MAFRNFRLICSIRAICLAFTIVGAVFLILETGLVATAIIVAAMAAFQVWGLIHFVDKSNRDLGRFLLSVRHSDFTSSFPDDGKGGSHRELREAFESVLREFRKTRSDRQEQYRYLQTVVQHVGIGLLAFDTNGKIDLINNAAKRLLGISVARNISDLGRVSPELVTKLQSLTAGQRELHRIAFAGETLQAGAAEHQVGFFSEHLRRTGRTRDGSLAATRPRAHPRDHEFDYADRLAGGNLAPDGGGERTFRRCCSKRFTERDFDDRKAQPGAFTLCRRLPHAYPRAQTDLPDCSGGRPS